MIQPRVIRAKDAPKYLGLDRNKFASMVRPYVTAIPLGKQAIGYDRLDLDAWFEDYKTRNGRPGAALKGGNNQWPKGRSQGSFSGPVSGTSKRGTPAGEFEKALAQAISGKRNGI